MEIVARRGGNGEIVLALDGELDLGTAEPLRESLLDAIENDGRGVSVDMRGCSFIDSTGSRRAWRRLRLALGGRQSCVSPMVR